jgi:hypothetical protein
MSAGESIGAFRAEARAWLEANCPPEMREPSRGEGDIVWGGRQQKLTAPQRLWLDRMAGRGWTTPDWPREFSGGGLSPAETKALRGRWRSLAAGSPCFRSASPCSGLRSSNTGPRRRSGSTCRRSCTARSAGARAIRSLGQARTLRACKLLPRTAATILSSTARRSGRVTPTLLPGAHRPLDEAGRHLLSPV